MRVSPESSIAVEWVVSVVAAVAVVTLGLAPLLPAGTAWADASGGPVSFFALRNDGSARAIGLAGATVALPGDPQLARGNPASPVFQPGLLELHWFGLGHGTAQPRFHGVNARKETGADLGLSVRPLDQAAVAGGYLKRGTRHDVDPVERSHLGVETESVDVPVVLAARIHERVGVGAGLAVSDREYARDAGESRSGAERTARQSFRGRAWRVGLVGAISEDFSVGASYESARDLARDAVEGDAASTATRYVEPWTLRAGICYLLSPGEDSLLPLENLFLLELDAFGWKDHGEESVRHPAATLAETGNTRLPYPSADRLGGSGATYDTGEKLVPRLGIETRWFQSPNARLATFVGSWFEPRYVDGGKGAIHTSVGAEFSLWRIALQAAADIHRDDVRTTWGLGVSWR